MVFVKECCPRGWGSVPWGYAYDRSATLPRVRFGLGPQGPARHPFSFTPSLQSTWEWPLNPMCWPQGRSGGERGASTGVRLRAPVTPPWLEGPGDVTECESEGRDEASQVFYGRQVDGYRLPRLPPPLLNGPTPTYLLLPEMNLGFGTARAWCRA